MSELMHKYTEINLNNYFLNLSKEIKLLSLIEYSKDILSYKLIETSNKSQLN